MSLSIKDNYATIFDPDVHDKWVSANMSTGRKSKDSGEDGSTKYINSYWNASFVGNAYKKAINLKNKDRIRIISGVITHEKSNKTNDSGTHRYFYNVIIFDFENLSEESSEGFKDENDTEGDLPF